MSADRYYSHGFKRSSSDSEVELSQATILYLKKSANIVNEIQQSYGVTISLKYDRGRNTCLIGPCHPRLRSQVRTHILGEVRQLVHKSYHLPNFDQLKCTPNQFVVLKLREERLWVSWYFNDKARTIELCGDSEQAVLRAYNLIAHIDSSRSMPTKRSYENVGADYENTGAGVYDQQEGPSRQGSEGHHFPRAKMTWKEKAEASLFEITTERREFEPEVFKYLILQKQNHWGQVDQYCEEKNVRVANMDPPTFTITLEGGKLDIAFVFTHIDTLVKTFSVVQQSTSKQFQNCYALLKWCDVLTALQSRQMFCGWDMRNGRLYVCSRSKKCAEEAMKVIRDLIVEEEYPIHEELSASQIAAVKEQKWNSFVAGIRSKHGAESLQVRYDEAKKKIEFALKANEDACSVVESFKEFFQPFNNFRGSMNVEREIAELLMRKRDFVLKQCSGNDTVEIDSTSCNFQSQSPESLQAAMDKLKQLIEQKSSDTVTYKKSSYVSWLLSITGGNKLADIDKLSQTISSVRRNSLVNTQSADPAADALKKIQVIKGDIAAVEADGIISSQGVIARVIEAKCFTGNQLCEGLQKVTMCRSRNTTSVVQVYHTTTPPWDSNISRLKQLGDSVRQAVRALSSLKVVAIPAIGTGGLHYPHDKVAALMIDTVLSCLKSAQADCNIEQVMFVIDHSSTSVYQAFDHELRARKSRASIHQKAVQASEEATVTFTGLQMKDVVEAVRRLGEEFELSMATADWSNSPLRANIQKLTQDEIDGIYVQVAASKVDIELRQEEEIIKLEGFKGEVESLRESINVMLHEKSVTSLASKALPSNWDKEALKNGLYEVELGSNSDEYRQVAQQFRSTTHRRTTINKITRIQNELLFTQYEAQKSKVRRELGGAAAIPVERTLWHGTTAESVKQICANEFNRSYAGKNATVYGVGSYFSTTSDYSIDYCSDSGYKHIILAKVATGQYKLGTQTMDRKSLPQGYHSTVNKQSNPTIFVVYHDAGAYPEYVIQFSLY